MTADYRLSTTMREHYLKRRVIQIFAVLSIIILMIQLLKLQGTFESVLHSISTEPKAISDLNTLSSTLNNEKKVQKEVLDQDHPADPQYKLPQYKVKKNTAPFQQNNDTPLDFRAEMEKLNKEQVAQDDPRLINLIRDYYIEPPSSLPYNLTYRSRTDFSRGQAPFIDSRLHYLEGGFFVECGALTGEKGSNSLFFEKTRKWTGLLIEADPLNYAELKYKHRKAFSINACLNTNPYPAKMTFNQNFNVGRISQNQEPKNQRITGKQTEVQCFPLYSILLALNRTSVDFFSLDIEGDEFPVLQTIPFDKVDIKMMTVEFIHGKPGSKERMQSYLLSKGYESLITIMRADWGANDIIFRKKELSYKRRQN